MWPNDIAKKSAFTQSDDLAMNVNKVGNLDE